MRSVNQNHHLYVVKAVNTVNESAAKGTIEAVVSGDNPKEKALYFKYKGRDGLTRSDFIPLDLITYAKYVPAADQQTYLKKVEVTLDSTINSGNAVVGQDYILNIQFQQFYGLSPENDYVKTVAVHVTSSNSTASDFYKAMVEELNAAFSREVGASAKSNPYLKFAIKYSGGTYEETNSNFGTATATGIVIEEKEQPWSLGKWEAESLVFNVFPSTIYNNGDEVTWGKAEPIALNANKNNLTAVNNSKKMADLEWFTYGERADYYRGMGYPNNFNFVPMVDPDAEDGYDALELHFAYQGTCEDIQKSEKDITLVGEAGDNAVIEDLVAALTELGIEVMNAPKEETGGNG